MAKIVSGATADILTIDATSKAARSSLRPIEGTRYRAGASTGLLAGVAAASATAGHIFAFRWGSATNYALIHRVRAKWVTVLGFTAAQEVGLDMILATGYSANHASGTVSTLTGVNLKKRQSFAASGVTDIRTSTTSALTAGTHTLNAQASAFGGYSELAAAATVAKGQFTLDFDGHVDFGGGPLELAQNEGFIIRNLITMGAGGTARVYIEVDWTEVGLGAGY